MKTVSFLLPLFRLHPGPGDGEKADVFQKASDSPSVKRVERFRVRVITGMLAVAWAGGAGLPAQNADDADGLAIRYQESKSGILKSRQEKTAGLFDSYATAIERLQTEFQGKADLPNALKVRKEVELARTQRAIGTEAIPGIDTFRATLRETLEKIDAEALAETSRLNLAYIAKLTEFRDAFTKAGNLQRALAIDTEIKALQASLSADGPAPAAPSTPAAAAQGRDATTGPPAGPVQVTAIETYVNDTPFREAMIGNSLSVPAGRHWLKGRVVIGNREVPAGAKPTPAIVAVPKESTIEGGEIYVDLGELHATQARFADVQLLANLGGQVFATACLLDNSSFEKAGGWFSGYSAKLTLNNCVVRKSIIDGEFTKGNVGIKFSFCTFIDVDFPPVAFSEDAGKEATEAWRTIESCRFINCKVPPSVLLMTKNCVFENCTFPERDDSAPVGNTSLSVALYHGGKGFPVPPNYGRSTFSVVDGSALQPPPGSTVKHKASASGLIFE